MRKGPWWVHRSNLAAERCTDTWWEYVDGADGEGWEPLAFLLPVSGP